jgi:pyruvate,water dikinase
VVGTSDATLRIRTGNRVRVNGSTGQVDVLSTSAKQAVHKATEESLLHI